MGFFKKIFKGVKKVFKKIGRGIKKVAGKIGKFMNKIGIVGQISVGQACLIEYPDLFRDRRLRVSEHEELDVAVVILLWIVLRIVGFTR